MRNSIHWIEFVILRLWDMYFGFRQGEQLEQAGIFGRKASTVHDKELARKFRLAGGKNSGLFWGFHLITDKHPK